jgi:hypothetical protein
MGDLTVGTSGEPYTYKMLQGTYLGCQAWCFLKPVCLFL